MNPSEAWSLLTIRSKNFALQSKAFGATTSADIAGLLSGLGREPFLMGMAAECGDMNSLKQIELVLWVRAKTIADRENWDAPRGYFTVRRMVGVALYEAMEDHCCYGCNGTGSMKFELRDCPGILMAPTFEAVGPDAGKVRCICCGGSGTIHLSGRKKADLSGVNKDMWTRLWSRRYESIFAIARDWRQSAKNHLAYRMRDEAEVDTATVEADFLPHSEDQKKVIPIKGSCAFTKRQLVSLARTAAPAVNAPPKELDFNVFQRALLRLGR